MGIPFFNRDSITIDINRTQPCTPPYHKKKILKRKFITIIREFNFKINGSKREKEKYIDVSSSQSSTQTPSSDEYLSILS